jgi:hypothetical protein
MFRQPDFRISPVASCVLAIALAALPVSAQQAPPTLPPPGQTLSANQLDDLVANIALYPDELLSQILVASTYPLEVVEAYQFQLKNTGLTGDALTQAVDQQNWDPSVQALVLFPDVLKQLNADVTWTTNLGNAFLAQQQDVMDAVQRMRQQAQQAGKLQSTPQEAVTTDSGDIDIEPTDPDVMYVPVYDPAWIWGPPLWYPYAAWGYPPVGFYGSGVYFGFGPAINVGFYFGAGWQGWRGWGWHPGWGNHVVLVNNTFVHQYGFNAVHVINVHGSTPWVHDPEHRAGVPYPTAALRNDFRGNVRQALAPRAIPEAAPRATPEPARNPAVEPNERFGNREVPQNRPEPPNRSAFSGQENGAAAATHAEHGFSSMGPARSAPMPAPRMSAPPAPRMSSPAPAPRSSGGRR